MPAEFCGWRLPDCFSPCLHFSLSKALIGREVPGRRDRNMPTCCCMGVLLWGSRGFRVVRFCGLIERASGGRSALVNRIVLNRLGFCPNSVEAWGRRRMGFARLLDPGTHLRTWAPYGLVANVRFLRW